MPVPTGNFKEQGHESNERFRSIPCLGFPTRYVHPLAFSLSPVAWVNAPGKSLSEFMRSPPAIFLIELHALLALLALMALARKGKAEAIADL